MKDKSMGRSQSVNQQRRKLLQGTACVGAVSVAPAAFGKAVLSQSESVVSGKLICKIYDPVKTLVLHNHSDQAVVIDRLAQSALMYDGNVVDCNTACLTKPITIPANKIVEVQFDKRKQVAVTRQMEDYRRIQSQVTRLSDGTRVIPFVANVKGRIATLA